MTSRFPTRVLLALATSLLLWASAFAGIRAGLRNYSPGHVALLRFLTASLALGIYAAVAHFRRPEMRDVPGLIFSGIIGITCYNLGLNYGETRVSAGAASLLVASTPILTVVLAMLFLHERLTVRGWGGVLISFVGVALIASGEGEGLHFSPEALIVLAAALSSAIYMVLQKYFLAKYSALEFTAYSIWAGTLFMLPFGRGLTHAIQIAPAGCTAAVIYLGIFPGMFAYVAWAYVLSHGAAGRTTTLLYLIPALAIGIAWVWLGEVPKLISLLGGAVALAGVVIVRLWGKVQSAEPKTKTIADAIEA